MTPTPGEAPATTFAVALLREFARRGVRDVVLSPGSRSQALALAAAEFERVGALRLHVRIDERVAGFLALGLAVESGRPVVIVTTSGTAVANLHPAVLEAHHSGVPLIVVTADRPDSLRGIGSNQTTEQPGIFGAAVSRTWDVAAPVGDPGESELAADLVRDALAVARGPVHLNLAFAEPLSSPFTLDASSTSSVEPHPTETVPATVGHPSGAPVALDAGGGRIPTVVVAGTGAGERAEEVARALGAPLLAEVSSGAHFGPNLVVSYRDLLHESEFGGAVRRVVVFGHPTLSREVPALIQRDDVETIVVRHRSAEDYNPGRRVTAFVDAVDVVGDPAPASWARRWVAASRALITDTDVAPDVSAPAGAHARAELAAVRAPVTRRALAEAVWRATWPHDRLILGASRLIREVDKVAPGKRIRVHANRGLAGIDGTIATAIGIALANPDSGTTRVLLGDLAFLHDVGALQFGVGEQRPRVQVIVGNDGGGTIFDVLEVAQSAGPGFERVLYTPQQAPVEALAAAYGWEYRRADTRGSLDQALTASAGPTIIEVPLPRS